MNLYAYKFIMIFPMILIKDLINEKVYLISFNTII